VQTPLAIRFRVGLSMKTLCKLKKDQLAELLPELAAELPQATHICTRCARAATDKRRLCKPISLLKLSAKKTNKET